MSDFLKFADEQLETVIDFRSHRQWKILIVDDEDDVHAVTKLAMENFSFQGRSLDFFHAYSGDEARKLLRENKDFAVIFLDVVMESDTAGLDLVRFIREELNNKLVRIILRTGQPGIAPEADVIVNYDINDYKSKTELTKSKLDTALISAIRSYNDMKVLEKSRKGLKQIISASSDLFEMNSMRNFIEGILLQLTGILRLEEDALYLETSALAIAGHRDRLKVIAGTGKYSGLDQSQIEDSIPPDIRGLIFRALERKESCFEDKCYIGYFRSADRKEKILFLEGYCELGLTDKYLIELLSGNINIALDNHDRHRDSLKTRDEILYRLGEISENGKPRNRDHVRRMGEVAFRLAELAGMNYKKAEEIKVAAAMHDVGNILLSRNIRTQNEPLTEEDMEEIRNHTEAGELILRGNRFELLENAADVAAQHHERWDGKGFPRRLKGEEISLEARIASLALVYDELGHDQPFRKAWKEDDILNYIKEESGKTFDPVLVGLFINNYPYISEVNKLYPQ